jgi:hypothetical protein
MLSALLFIAAAASGDEIVKKATPLKSLDDFLDSYMGECTKGEPDQIKECQEAAKKFRAECKDKTFLVDVPSKVVSRLTPAQSKSNDVMVYEFTPFFDGGGFGMSFEKPKNQGGAPVVRREKLKIPAPKNPDDESPILEAIKVDRVGVQLVFKPTEMWKLTKKGSGFWYGLQVKPLLLRLTDQRGGDIADTIF